VLFQTLGITAALGNCVGSDPSVYGPDGILCTDDDPVGGIIAVAGTLPLTTGTATAVVHNANGSNGIDLGPVTTTGAPFNCSGLESGDTFSAVGAGLVGAFTFVHLDTVGDVAATSQLFAGGSTLSPTPTPVPCAGDCDHDGTVTINELITMVDVALAAIDLDACTAGDIDHGGQITVDEIIVAVNNTLNDCGAG